jgi:small subunit ribosomal protein MRP21
MPKTNVLDKSQTNKTRGWAAAQGGQSSRGTPLTGRAQPSPSQDLFAQITSDMEQTTGGLANWNPDEFLQRHYGAAEPEMRLRPSTGRTVQIKNNVDLARGFVLLNKLTLYNRVKVDERTQRFHERPALKRKRQKRERWQRRFKQGFRGCLERVWELKAQGW